MANKIKYGIKNVHYAKMTETVTTTGTTISWGTPVALPGAKSISLSANGDREVFYADDSEYVILDSNNGYEGDLEIAAIPDAFLKDILAEAEDDDHVLVEKANAQKSYFALGFEVQGDVNSTLFWFYKCYASRPEASAETKEDKITPSTDKISLACYPDHQGYVRVKTTGTTSTTERSGWFTEVYRPTFTP